MFPRLVIVWLLWLLGPQHSGASRVFGFGMFFFVWSAHAILPSGAACFLAGHHDKTSHSSACTSEFWKLCEFCGCLVLTCCQSSTEISFQNASVDDLGPEPTKIQRGKETLRNCSSFWLTWPHWPVIQRSSTEEIHSWGIGSGRPEALFEHPEMFGVWQLESLDRPCGELSKSSFSQLGGWKPLMSKHVE